MSKQNTVILLAGHGGYNEDRSPAYATFPSKMHYHDPAVKGHKQVNVGGSIQSAFYEGVWNREFCQAIAPMFERIGLPVVVMHDPYHDTSLWNRVRRINHLAKFCNPIVFEIHANAFNGRDGKGMEIFTSPNETPSDRLATNYIDAWKIITAGAVPFRPDYSDGDGDKEARFTVMNNTTCPHVLIEHEFFDTLEGVLRLQDEDYIHQCGLATIMAALNFFYPN